MNNWWESLGTLEQIYWITGLSGTLIFLIQTMMAFFGGGHDHDHDFSYKEVGEAGISNLKEKQKVSLITIRNIIIFFAVAGWVGIGFLKEGFSQSTSIIASLFSGLGAMALSKYMLQNILKLAIDKTIKTKDAIHQVGEVYHPIPAKESGKGKILINIKGAQRELDACTTGKALSVGTKVLVIDMLEQEVVLVEEWKEE